MGAIKAKGIFPLLRRGVVAARKGQGQTAALIDLLSKQGVLTQGAITKAQKILDTFADIEDMLMR